MAMQTHIIAFLAWDDFLSASVELDYDDADFRARTIRVTNLAPRAIVIEASRVDRSRVYTRSFDGLLVSTLTIPTQPGNRLQLTVTPPAKLNGIEWSVRWAEA